MAELKEQVQQLMKINSL